MPESATGRYWIGWSAAAMCVLASLAGGRFIFIYRYRIYHLRRRREDLSRHIRPVFINERYNIHGSLDTRNQTTWLFPPIERPVGSESLLFTLLLIGILAAVFNLAAMTFAGNDTQALAP